MRKTAQPQKSVVIPWWLVIGVAVLLLGVLSAVAWWLGGPVAAVTALAVVLLPTVGARALWQALGVWFSLSNSGMVRVVVVIGLLTFGVVGPAFWLAHGPVAAAVAVGVVVLPVGGFLALLAWGSYRQAQVRALLEVKGRPVKAWVVFANEALYGENFASAAWPAQVVFTTDPGVKKPSELLTRLAAELREFEAEDGADEEEQIIASVVRSQIGYYTPLRVPDRLTGGAVVYTVSVSVPCDLLPSRKLTEPYVHCRVLVDPDDRRNRYARVVADPKQKKSKKRYGPLTWEDKGDPE
jgi:hypothetical protein